MRRIRLDRRHDPREQGQQITLTVGELRAQLEERYAQGKADKQAEVADTLLQLGDRIAQKDAELGAARRQVDMVQDHAEQLVIEHNKKVNKLTDRIRELELAGPLTMLNNKVRRNANRKTKNQTTRPRKYRNGRSS